MNQMRKWVLAAASLSLLGGLAIDATVAGAEEAPATLTLKNNTAGVQSCPVEVVGLAWHFVAPPKSKTDFEAITLQLRDVNGVVQPVLITSWLEIPLSGDAYVAVPSGYTLTSLVGGTFLVSGDPVDEYVRLSHTCGTQPPPPPSRPVLTVTKTATHTSSADFDWSVVKTVKAYRLNNAGTIDVDYDIVVTKSALGNQMSTVTGTITVQNAATNSADAVITSVTDDILGTTEESCDSIVVTDDKRSLPVGGSQSFNYSCMVPYGSTGSDTNEAVVSFTYGVNNANNGSKSDTQVFDYVKPTITDPTTDLNDDFGTLGVPGDDFVRDDIAETTKFSYTRPAVVPGGTACNPGFINIATVTDPTFDDNGGNTSSATVKLCTNTNGWTIGFWGNKNGWNLLKSGTYFGNVVKAYPAVATYAGLPWSSQTKAREFFQTANCSGDCKSMFAAQFVATAFNVQRNSTLGETKVVIPPALASQFTPQTCVTINAVLAKANTYFTTIDSTKVATTTAYKSLFDRINNNQAYTCT